MDVATYVSNLFYQIGGCGWWNYIGAGLWALTGALVPYIGFSLAMRWLAGKQREGVARLRKYIACLGGLGGLLGARLWYCFPEESPLFQTIIRLVGIGFLVVSLLVVHYAIESLFAAFIDQAPPEAATSQSGWLLTKVVVKVLLWGLILVVAPRSFIAYEVAPLLAQFSLGAGSLAALAALVSRDVVGSIFGALVVIISKPFRMGDWIMVGSRTGWVVDIGLRTTTLAAETGATVHIPNAAFVKEHLVNFGPAVYQLMTLRLVLERAQESAFRAFVAEMERTLHLWPGLLPISHFHMHEFGHPSTLTVHLFWKKGMARVEQLVEGQRLWCEIDRLVRQAGLQTVPPAPAPPPAR